VYFLKEKQHSFLNRSVVDLQYCVNNIVYSKVTQFYTHTHTHTHTHIYIYIYIYTHILLSIFSIMVYHRILNIVN